MDKKSTVHNQLMETYNKDLSYSGISGERLAERIDALSKIGATNEGGVSRSGYSEEELKAKKLLIEWMEKAGLEVTHDGAGNVFGRLEGETSKQAVGSGSHLDTVPNGGNFDGVLGVLTALEIAESWKTEGYTPKVPFEVVVFSEEEGSRLKALFGSQAFVGVHTKEELKVLKDKEARSFNDIIEEYGSSIKGTLNAKRKPYAFFAETHIEQGTVLEEVDQPVGIVNGIAGPLDLNITFTGESGHAGNTPMDQRRDPLVASGLFVNEISKLPKQFSESAVATVGQLNVFPNGSNVIPDHVKLTVDIRDIEESTRNELVKAVEEKAKDIAWKYDVEVNIEQEIDIKPMPINEKWQELLAQSLRKHSITPTYIPSGAGHDSMILGRFMPVAMLFVRSQGGISHNPKEWSALNDCVMGIHILSDFLKNIIEKQ